MQGCGFIRNVKRDQKAAMTQIKSPTRYMLVIARTCADGSEADYTAVNVLQEKYDLQPLSALGDADWKYPTPPVNADVGYSMSDKPQKAILGSDTEDYFNRMATMICHDAPAATEDAPALAVMAKIGVVPCETFELSRLDPAVQDALKDFPQQAIRKIAESRDSVAEVKNRWVSSGTSANTRPTR